MTPEKRSECVGLARTVRAHCLRMVHLANSGHIGSMLSPADILAVLYSAFLRVDPAAPRAPDRDRLILSKGHGGAALYAVLAEKGFFPKEWLQRYYVDDGRLSGHISHHVPGVEFSTGSLGHGLPVAAGMAMAARQAGRTHRIVCICSDGDCNAGSTWEAIMLAGQHGWDNLTMIVDYNRLQALGRSRDIIDLEPLDAKLRQFAWATEVIDGHDVDAIEKTLLRLPFEAGKPSAIIARTVKGKGVSFMENDFNWHYGGLVDDLFAAALAEVEGQPHA